jgi:homocysteine S-methyltransferase
MRKWHEPRIAALVDAGVDLLALETIPCQEEAEMLVELIKKYPNAKAWLSFSCRVGIIDLFVISVDSNLTFQDHESIAHGENFQKVAKKCWDSNPEQLIAIGVNCLRPSDVKHLITGINKNREINKIPLIVYPNSGEKYNPKLG